jgi:hypothetical protein
MTETWRIKRYYDPRVLIGVEDTLTCPYPGLVVCLEGSELNVLRNLLQYAHRRATWVSEYHDSYYLAPSNEEWDQIEALVAGLEEKLVPCSEIVELLEDLVACACATSESQARSTFVSHAAQPVIQSYLDDGAMIRADVYGGETPVNEECCAVAQLAYWTAWEILTEILQPLEDVTFDSLMPLLMVNLAIACGETIIGIPVSIVLAVLWCLFEVWEDGALQNVQNEYLAYKQELVCAMYDGLQTSYADAKAAASDVIGEMSALSPIDALLLRKCLSPWCFHVAQIAWDNQTSWAVAAVEEGYCVVCIETPIGHEFAWEWPPCSNGQFVDGGVCYGGRLCFNGDVTVAHQAIQSDLEVWNHVMLGAKWRSSHGIGNTVGGIYLDRWNPSTEDWTQLAAFSPTNNVGAGELNIANGGLIEVVDQTEPNYRVRVSGASGQHETEPYPLMLEYLHCNLSYVPPP